ncbi:zinc-dependent alcohol dehydrogenase [Pontimicrobium sp. IMCC45349]|uniref:zinc-dependent alcohol dehydrogenase n=1 Tax=Pontimicrobium sp. IMCC45349 TaxID=3391574 RepID=UPI0039A2F8F9
MIKSLWHTQTTTELRLQNTPDLSAAQSKVISKYSMISLGTETLVLNKKIPETIKEYMKVPHMEGNFDLPIKYGYALSGVLNNGEKAHLMHPHQDNCFVDNKAIFKSCQELPLTRIPLISNMETVINAIWDSNVTKTDSIVVCGFGNIGSLLASTLKHHYNFEVKVIETNVWRKQKAIELGFEIYNDNNGFDIAFNTTSNEEALQFCIDNANEEGQIIELSWYGKSNTSLKLGENFHKNRLRLIASQVSKIPIQKRKEFDYFKRKLLAVDILKNKIFDKLITNIIPFDEVPDFFELVRKNKTPNGLIYLIKY